MADTLGTQIDRVQNAIAAIESGRSSSYEIEGRKLTYIDLPTLYKREQALLHKISLYGRNYVEGQNASGLPRRARVEFGW